MICICFAQGLVVTYEIAFGSCWWQIYVHEVPSKLLRCICQYLLQSFHSSICAKSLTLYSYLIYWVRIHSNTFDTFDANVWELIEKQVLSGTSGGEGTQCHTIHTLMLLCLYSRHTAELPLELDCNVSDLNSTNTEGICREWVQLKCEIFTIIINNSFFISSFSWPNLVSLLFLVLVLLLHSLCFLDLGSVSVYHVAHPFCKSLRRGDPNLCKPWDNQRAQNEFIKRLFFETFWAIPCCTLRD